MNKTDKYSNDYRFAELKKEKNLLFGKDGFFYEIREQNGRKEARLLCPAAQMSKFRRYRFDNYNIIIECHRDKYAVVLVAKDELETESVFYFCSNGYRFIRVIKYLTIHKQAFETYIRGSGYRNYTFSRQEMFYSAAGNEYLCPPQNFAWEPLEEVEELAE